VRRFVIIGQNANAAGDFSLDDLPSTSGRLDVLLRCLRAALLVSHGLRRDARAYLVLLGGAGAPKTLRFDGDTARYLRPDERSLAVTVKKVLAVTVGSGSFSEVRPGISSCEAGLEVVLSDVPARGAFLLEAGAPDVRESELEPHDCTFFLGDHLGLSAETRQKLEAFGVAKIGLGPLDLHAEDAIAVVSNELDRRLLGADPR
jgi:tRNA (pseudouridine54-N1)-methyltransferase